MGICCSSTCNLIKAVLQHNPSIHVCKIIKIVYWGEGQGTQLLCYNFCQTMRGELSLSYGPTTFFPSTHNLSLQSCGTKIVFLDLLIARVVGAQKQYRRGGSNTSLGSKTVLYKSNVSYFYH